MIVKAHKILFNDDKEPEMWEHYCEEEETEMKVGKGELLIGVEKRKDCKVVLDIETDELNASS